MTYQLPYYGEIRVQPYIRTTYTHCVSMYLFSGGWIQEHCNSVSGSIKNYQFYFVDRKLNEYLTTIHYYNYSDLLNFAGTYQHTKQLLKLQQSITDKNLQKLKELRKEFLKTRNDKVYIEITNILRGK